MPATVPTEHLAGVDADPHAQLVGGMLLAEVAQRGLHRQRRADGAVGVVLVRDRRPEQRHDRVAEHLVDDAAVGLDVGDEQREGGVDQALDLFGVAAFGDRREADDVGEQHGDDPPFLVGDRLGNGQLSSGVPQIGQKRAPSGTGCEHAGHPIRGAIVAVCEAARPGARNRRRRTATRDRPRVAERLDTYWYE